MSQGNPGRLWSFPTFSIRPYLYREGFRWRGGSPGRRGAGCVSKRGVDDGNQKGGGPLQPAKENYMHYIKRLRKVKKNFKFFFLLLTLFSFLDKYLSGAQLDEAGFEP